MIPTLFLKAQELSCTRADKCLFQNKHFELYEGEILLIEGSNGAGKTSLLQMLAGLLPYESGKIDFSHSQSPLYLGHKSGIHLDLTVQENILFLMALHNVQLPIHPILEKLNLTHYAHHLARNLSSGQKRRILLSILLFKPTPLWLLDEPLTSLDAVGQTLIHDLILKHIASKGGIIMSSHHTLALGEIPLKRLVL